MNNQTTDILTMAELGRSPVMGTIIKQSYSYWQHVLQTNNESLLYQANINLDMKRFISYYSRIKGVLAVLEAKSTIYCLDKGQAKRKSSELCSK